MEGCVRYFVFRMNLDKKKLLSFDKSPKGHESFDRKELFLIFQYLHPTSW